MVKLILEINKKQDLALKQLKLDKSFSTKQQAILYLIDKGVN